MLSIPERFHSYPRLLSVHSGATSFGTILLFYASRSMHKLHRTPAYIADTVKDQLLLTRTTVSTHSIAGLLPPRNPGLPKRQGHTESRQYHISAPKTSWLQSSRVACFCYQNQVQ